MIMPGPDKQRAKYEEARQRAAAVYRRHPRLQALRDEIDALLRSVDIAESEASKSSTERLKQLKQQYQAYLRKHGIPPSFAEPRFDCPHCQDSGWVVEIDEEASGYYGYSVERYVKCRCLINAEKQYRIEKLFARARMTAEQRKQRFENFKLDVYSDLQTKNGETYREIMTANKEVALQFVAAVKEGYTRIKNGMSLREFMPSLFFHGPTGVGKTFLCSAIANALLGLGVPVLYMPFTDLLGTIRASFSDKTDKDTQHLLDEVREIDVLILDDLGAENITGFVGETLFTIINYRLTSDFKPTVISSNLNLDQIGSSYNERIKSRIEQRALVLECVGPDLRERFALNKKFQGFPSWK